MVQAHYLTEEERALERAQPLSFETNPVVAPDPAEDTDTNSDSGDDLSAEDS
jgi:hypothetical protein